MKLGVGDILGAQLGSTPSHSVVFGLHYGLHRALPGSRQAARMRLLNEPLHQAASLHLRLNNHGWRSSVAGLALEQLGAAVIVTDPEGRIVELNRAGERMLSADDRLTVRHGKLGALRNFETVRLMALIAAATTLGARGPTSCMLIGSREGGVPYTVSVTPLGTEQALSPGPLAMVLVADPEQRQASATDLAHLFGFSPAESRVAAILLRGRKLSEVAVETGVRMTTLSTQLSSVLKKVGVSRQVDLIRILTSIPAVPRADGD
jgi:DNA-binding CsgD family transcriptional regulator